MSAVHSSAHDPQNSRYVLGAETEYGIVAVDSPELSPVHTSTQAVIAYAEVSGQGVNRRTRWDYESESPLRDTRGFDLRRYRTGAAPSYDPNAVGIANVITPAGARFYVDHAHPEYSSPEVSSAREVVVWDQAGDRVMLQAAQAASRVDGQPELKIYKNNVDGKGASYGAHENYLYPRRLDLEEVHQALIPHFVTRQIYAGAGRVGLGPAGQEKGFQISQRADYIETEVSLETTLNRGIVNTRDEPHADAELWRRLHVIIGDANLSQFATYLRFGTTALVLKAVEAGADFSDLTLVDPVGDVQRVSRDLKLHQELQLYGKNTATAVEIQKGIRQRILNALSAPGATTADEDNVLALWGDILEDLERDPLSTADRLDWTAKYSLLRAYHARGLSWDDPRMALIDLQYHDIDPDRGLHHALVARGKMRTLVAKEEIAEAVDTAPRSTRAWLRGLLVKHYSQHILAANWDSVVLDMPEEGHPALQIRLPDPVTGQASDFAGTALAEVTNTAPGLAEAVAAIRHVLPESIVGVG